MHCIAQAYSVSPHEPDQAVCLLSNVLTSSLL